MENKHTHLNAQFTQLFSATDFHRNKAGSSFHFSFLYTLSLSLSSSPSLVFIFPIFQACKCASINFPFVKLKIKCESICVLIVHDRYGCVCVCANVPLAKYQFSHRKWLEMVEAQNKTKNYSINPFGDLALCYAEIFYAYCDHIYVLATRKRRMSIRH